MGSACTALPRLHVEHRGGLEVLRHVLHQALVCLRQVPQHHPLAAVQPAWQGPRPLPSLSHLTVLVHTRRILLPALRGIKLSVGLTCQVDLLEIERLFTQGWRLSRTPGESVGGDWTVLIGRTGSDTRISIPDPTLSLSCDVLALERCQEEDSSSEAEKGRQVGVVPWWVM